MAAQIISVLRTRGTALWLEHERYVCITDASCSPTRANQRATARQHQSLAGHHNLPTEPRYEFETEADRLKDESEDLQRRVNNGEEAYIWLYYRTGWNMWSPKKLVARHKRRWKLA